MDILVVGRGGREHSIVKKFSESEKVKQIYVAPGNDGMRNIAKCVAIDETDIDGLIEFAKENKIDLTFVGPENPLMLGIADKFIENDLPIFAPKVEAALLEGSKSFAKAFMKRHAIPTADYATFTDLTEAKQYIEEKGAPIVIKADGLAAGKGVVVAETKQEAIEAVESMLVDQVFAESGSKIVIEEFLAGREFTLMAFVHEHHVYPMIPARDYKRAYDNNEGLNTGGMGAFAPVPDITDETIQYAIEAILQKTADGMMKEDRPFTGILYAGLMMTENGPKVIEFNTRFGDPETQVVLPLLKNDLLQVLVDVLSGKDPELQWEEKACLGVVLAAKGYPGSYEKNLPLPNLTQDETYTIYAGVKQGENGLVSNGGRVLFVGAVDDSFSEAATKVYQTLATVKEEDGFFYRTDIGKNIE